MHFLELHGPQSLTQFDGFWWDSAHQHFVVLRNGAFRALCAAPNDRRGDGCAGGRFAVVAGACFVAEAAAARIAPGDLVEVLVELPGGGEIRGATRVPGRFELDGIPDVCSMPPDVLMTVDWSPAADAWAYLNETSIRGLPDALRPEGIIVRDDPLYLLGLSVSDSDTTVVFPSEFGVFNRFDLDSDLAIRLQRGLPAGSTAELAITAVDRNYVNWARGGNFNPSGQVRAPSLSGDGTGVFGSTVGRGFDILVTDRPSGLPACPLD